MEPLKKKLYNIFFICRIKILVKYHLPSNLWGLVNKTQIVFWKSINDRRIFFSQHGNCFNGLRGIVQLGIG